MTPQGNLFSTVPQSSRAGDDLSKLNSLGNMKASATMNTAEVALDSLTLVGGSLCVRPLNTSRSAQPKTRLLVLRIRAETGDSLTLHELR